MKRKKFTDNNIGKNNKMQVKYGIIYYILYYKQFVQNLEDSENYKIRTSYKLKSIKYDYDMLKPYTENNPEIKKVIKVARFIPILGDGFIMQIRRTNPDKGKFEFPGGKIEPTDENSRYAIQREVLEEIGKGFTAFQCFDYLQTTYRIVNGILYISDFWMTDDIDERVFFENCSDISVYIGSWDFLEYTDPEEFAFDHYEVAKGFALNIGN